MTLPLTVAIITIMTKLEQIGNLTGFVDTKQFIQSHPLSALTSSELLELQTKVSLLNSHFEMDALVALVSGEMQTRDSKSRTRTSNLMALAALLIAFVSAVYTVLNYYR